MGGRRPSLKPQTNAGRLNELAQQNDITMRLVYYFKIGCFQHREIAGVLGKTTP